MYPSVYICINKNQYNACVCVELKKFIDYFYLVPTVINFDIEQYRQKL